MLDSESRRNLVIVGGAGLLLFAAVTLVRWWTRPPAVEFDNLKYIQLLTTAVSARNEDWLAKVTEAVDKRFAEGQMADAEHRHFQRIIDVARAGDWEAADKQCFAFAEAQLSRWRSKPATAAHDHDHGHDHSHTHGHGHAAAK